MEQEAPSRPEQLRLVPVSAMEVCRQIGLDWLSALTLWNEGLLSFDPKAATDLDDGQEAELTFLGALVVGGCDIPLMRQMLSGLRKPYAYRHGSIYYDWSILSWETKPPVPVRGSFGRALDGWLGPLEDAREIEAIRELRDGADAILERYAEGGE